MRLISGNLNGVVKVRENDTEYKVDRDLITVMGTVDDYSCPVCESLLVHGRVMIFPHNSDVKSGNDADAVWCPVCFDVF